MPHHAKLHDRARVIHVPLQQAMLLSLPLTFRGDLGQRALPAEFAPEAKLSAIHPAWLPGLAVPADLGHRRGCRGQRPPTVTHAMRLEFKVSGEWLSDEFFGLPELPCAVRLARPTIRQWGIGRDVVRVMVWVNPARTAWRLGGPRPG